MKDWSERCAPAQKHGKQSVFLRQLQVDWGTVLWFVARLVESACPREWVAESKKKQVQARLRLLDGHMVDSCTPWCGLSLFEEAICQQLNQTMSISENGDDRSELFHRNIKAGDNVLIRLPSGEVRAIKIDPKAQVHQHFSSPCASHPIVGGRSP